MARTLREMMAASDGMRLLEVAAYAVDIVALARVAESVECHGDRLDPAARQVLADTARGCRGETPEERIHPHDQALAGWELEVRGDPEVRRWLLDGLAGMDPAARAEMEISADVSTRPFTLEVDNGSFRCSNCGQEGAGRHARIVDRGQQLWHELADDQLHYCAGCLTAAAAAVAD